MKKTRIALAASFIGLLLCVALMMGVTYAWFSVTVQSGTNVIRTGKFDVKIEYSSDLSTWTALDESAVPFGDVVIMPGQSEIRYIRITNSTDSAVNASLSLGEVSVTDENTDLRFYCKILDSEAPVTVAEMGEGEPLNGVAAVFDGNEIPAGESLIAAIAIEFAGNTESAGIEASFRIIAGATQKTD